MTSWVGAELAKKGECNERNQYFLRSAYRALHHPPASLVAQAENKYQRVPVTASRTEDVPFMWIDHVSARSSLLGVWRALCCGGVLDLKEMKRVFVQGPVTPEPEPLAKPINRYLYGVKSE